MVIPEQEFTLSIAVYNGGPYEFPAVRTHTDFPSGWDVRHEGSSGGLIPGGSLEQTFRVRVSREAEFTQPYWLREPHSGDRFVWPDGPPSTLPFDRPLLLTGPRWITGV